MLAGHDPFVDGKPAHSGKLGAALSTQQGRSAAHIVTLNLFATLKAELAARPVARIVKVVGRQLEPVDAAPLPASRTTPTITMSPSGADGRPVSPHTADRPAHAGPDLGTHKPSEGRRAACDQTVPDLHGTSTADRPPLSAWTGNRVGIEELPERTKYTCPRMTGPRLPIVVVSAQRGTPTVNGWVGYLG